MSLLELQKAKVVQMALRYDFAIFLQRCFMTLNPGVTYIHNWHIDALTYELSHVSNGNTKRLIINLPPRNLKSIIISVAYVAFVLGHDPSKRIFVISYGAELAAEHAAQFRAIVTSEWYQRTFPKMRISRFKDDGVYTIARGFRRTTSIMGPMTGMGGDLFIIDDPQKPIDALSDLKRDGLNNWVSNTLLSRLDSKERGAIIVVQQRVHLDDLSGYLMSASKSWRKLSLSAIAEVPERIQIGEDAFYSREAGEALHPQFESTDTLEGLRLEMGPTFAAQYQQRPEADGGTVFRADWISYHEPFYQGDPGSYVLQSWDTAGKLGPLNSYSVCTTWIVQHGRYYLIDLVRDRFTFPDLCKTAILIAEKYGAREIVIEDASSGTYLAQSIEREVSGRIELVRPHANKFERAYAQQTKFSEQRVSFPKNAPFNEPLLHELLRFPQSRYSDQVDSVCQALAFERGYNLDNFEI